jgi:hypothetical protein
MTSTVFFSWQVDTDPKTGRNLIERALERAVGSIGDDTSVDEAVRDLAVDRDTRGVAGTPPIVETIFRKIDAAAAFVPDLTFVGKRSGGRPTPNPNVLIEYGWALKSLGHLRIVPVMNTFYGDPTPNDMPFDMRHLRNPIQYNCAPDADDATVKRVKSELGKELDAAIRAVLDSDEYRASLPTPPAPSLFVARVPADGRGRFKAKNEPIGVVALRLLESAGTELMLADAPITWLRVMPVSDPGQTWSVTELKAAATTNGLHLEPLGRNWPSYGYFRSADGFGVYPPFPKEPGIAHSAAMIFNNGEVWSIDAYLLDAMKRDERNIVPGIEEEFRYSLKAYADLLLRLGIPAPFRWIAGMENLRGRSIYVPAPAGRMSMFGPHGSCLEDVVVAEGTYSPGEPLGHALKSFFAKLFDSCGVDRPARLDE